MSKRFNIIDTVDYLKIPHVGRNNNPNELKIECPYCHDSRGKATVKATKNGKEANVFNCWACGKTGNMTTLYFDIKGGFSDYKEAYRDMKKELGDGTKYQPTFSKNIPKVKICKKRASDEDLDRTYRTMLSFIRLKKRDKDDLLRRSLTEEEIVNGMFRSTPTDTTGICRKLLKAGCVLEGVPGFYKNRSNEWTLNVYRDEGYFCPVFQNNMLVGMQIRLARPMDGCKYIWLSSSDREYGTPAGTPASFYGSPDAQTVIVTEGILKSYVTHCLWPEAAIIGVPGVSVIGDVDKLLKRNHHKVMVEAYDMDKRQNIVCRQDYKEETCQNCQKNGFCYYNRQFCRCEKKLKKITMLIKAIANLKKVGMDNGLTISSYYWDKDPYTGLWLENFKGIDDFLASKREGGGTNALNQSNTNPCVVPGRGLPGGNLQKSGNK